MARTSEQLTNEEIEIVEQLSDVANSNYVYRDMNWDFVGMAGWSGSGDVVWPASAVDNNFASFNLTTGKIIKDSGYNAASFTAANSPITGATKTKITYDAKGLVTAGADATTADIAASTDKNYVTDAQQTIIASTTASYTTADETKIDYITVTSAVNLDTMATAVAALDQATILKGTWDASAGTFPGAGVAQAGWTYIVSVAGTVDSVAFNINDRILAIVDNASTTTFSGNWFKLDYTDQVLSVAGKTGAVTLDTNDVSDVTNKRYVTDADLTVLSNTSGTNTGDNATNTQYSGLAASKADVANPTFTGTVTTPWLTNTGEIVLGENGIRLDEAISADGQYSGTVISGTAGATLAFGDLIYLDPTDSRRELTDANSASGADGDARGIVGLCVLAAASDGSATKILLQGMINAATAFPAITVNAPLYVSETAGDITHTQPTTTDAVIKIIGVGFATDQIYFNPSQDWITHT